MTPLKKELWKESHKFAYKNLCNNLCNRYNIHTVFTGIEIPIDRSIIDAFRFDIYYDIYEKFMKNL